MEIADVDGSGTIDPAEFHEFISKLDESATEDSSKTVFDSIDADGDGQLTVAEFGAALFECLKSMKSDEAGVEDGEEGAEEEN